MKDGPSVSARAFSDDIGVSEFMMRLLLLRADGQSPLWRSCHPNPEPPLP